MELFEENNPLAIFSSSPSQVYKSGDENELEKQFITAFKIISSHHFHFIMQLYFSCFKYFFFPANDERQFFISVRVERNDTAVIVGEYY